MMKKIRPVYPMRSLSQNRAKLSFQLAKLMGILAVLGLTYSCGNQPIAQTPETQPPTTAPADSQTAATPGDRTLETLPNGDYFYGMAAVPDAPGTVYLIFRKADKSLTGLKYTLGTDSGSCFTGTAEAETLTQVKAAYPEPSREGTTWVFSELEPINFSELQNLKLDQRPEFTQQYFQECVQVFQDAISQSNQAL